MDDPQHGPTADAELEAYLRERHLAKRKGLLMYGGLVLAAGGAVAGYLALRPTPTLYACSVAYASPEAEAFYDGCLLAGGDYTLCTKAESGSDAVRDLRSWTPRPSSDIGSCIFLDSDALPPRPTQTCRSLGRSCELDSSAKARARRAEALIGR